MERVMNKKDVRSEYIHKMALLVSRFLNKKESLQTQDSSSDDI
jgi:hypothetical protein